MLQLFKEYQYFFKKYKKNQIIGLTTLVLSYFALLFEPYFVGKISNDMKTNNLDHKGLLMMTGIFLILAIFSYGMNYIWNFRIFKNDYLMQRDTRNEIMKKLLHQTPEFFQKHSTGSIMGKATNDLRTMAMVVGYGLMGFFDGFIYPFMIFILMFRISWKLTLIAMIISPTIIIILSKAGAYLSKIFQEVQQAFDEMNESALESITGIRVLRAFGVEEVFQKKFIEKIHQSYEKDMKRVRIDSIFEPITMGIMGILTAMIIYLGAYFIEKGEMTIGGLISFTMYTGLLTWPSYVISDLIIISKEGLIARDRVREILETKETVLEEESLAVDNFYSIEFRDYSFKYPGEDRRTLDSINVMIRAGETIGIVGKTGSGKSTFLRQFLREYNKEKGEILLNNLPIENYSLKDIRSLSAYVPQDHFLFSKTIEENIRFFREIKEEDLKKAMESADLTKDLAQLQKGEKTLCGEKGISLSGGQKQRISFARALMNQPQILLLDDVLSAVDTRTEQQIIENLKKVRKNKTNIISSHRLSVIKDADLILVLEDGKIVQRGSHKQLYQEKGWYQEQFDKQMGEERNEQ